MDHRRHMLHILLAKNSIDFYCDDRRSIGTFRARHNQRIYLGSACVLKSSFRLTILGNHDQDADTATINQAVRQVPGIQLLTHKPTLLHRNPPNSNPAALTPYSWRAFPPAVTPAYFAKLVRAKPRFLICFSTFTGSDVRPSNIIEAIINGFQPASR